MPVLKMFVLYDEQEPLPIPDIADRHCVIKLSAAGLFIHLSIKAQSNGHLAFKLPTALVRHYEFLQQLLNNDLNVQTSLRQDFLVPLVCNTYSTSQEIFQVWKLFWNILSNWIFLFARIFYILFLNNWLWNWTSVPVWPDWAIFCTLGNHSKPFKQQLFYPNLQFF